MTIIEHLLPPENQTPIANDFYQSEAGVGGRWALNWDETQPPRPLLDGCWRSYRTQAMGRGIANALPVCDEPIMTVLAKVRALVTRLSPEPICDDCVAEKLEFAVRQNANRKARELAGSDGFERRKGQCGICGLEKLVTRLI